MPKGERMNVPLLISESQYEKNKRSTRTCIAPLACIHVIQGSRLRSPFAKKNKVWHEKYENSDTSGQKKKKINIRHRQYSELKPTCVVLIKLYTSHPCFAPLLTLNRAHKLTVFWLGASESGIILLVRASLEMFYLTEFSLRHVTENSRVLN